MRIASFVITTLTIGSFGLINSPQSLSADLIAQLDNLEGVAEVSMSVLDRLGYECDTVADVGLVCKKCTSNSIVSEKCTAYICDAATRKCRKRNATLPKLPGSDE